jgi:competence protein CoiA
MQYAILGNQRREAAPGLFGECPSCQSRVFAKCGKQRVWHWEHLGKVTYDFEESRDGMAP